METIKIRTPDLTLVQEINFDTLASMEISRELSGDHSVRFSLPVNADHVAELKAGRMLDIQGQRYEVRSRTEERTRDDLALVEVEAVHWFFLLETQVLHQPIRVTGDLEDHLNNVLGGTDFTFSIIGNHPVYDVERTIQHQRDDTRLDRLKRVMVRYFCHYRLQLNTVEIMTRSVMSDPGASFEYGLNLAQAQRFEDHFGVVTQLVATGGMPDEFEEEEEPAPITRVVDAPAGIKALYRGERVAHQNFGDMTDWGMFVTITDMFLEDRQTAEVSYELSAAELGRINGIQTTHPGVYAYDVGDLVTVEDGELGIDEKMPIQRYTEYPLVPEEPSRFTIGRKPRELWQDDLVGITDQDVRPERFRVTIQRIGGSWEEKTYLSPFVGGPSMYDEGSTLVLRASVPEESSWTFEGWSINGEEVTSREHVIEVAEDLNITGTFVEELDPQAQAIPLYGFISASSPDDALGQENDLWIQYEGGV